MAAARSRGQIVQKGKDRYLVRIPLGRDANGKRRYFSKVVEGSKSKAQKYLTGKLREKDLGMFVENSAQTISEHVDEWLSIIKHSVAVQTYESYESLIAKHIRPRIGHLKLSEIRQTHVQAVYDSMLSDGLSPRTVRYVHAVQKRTFQKAIEQNKILRNPCDFVSLPKQLRPEIAVMSPSEAKIFIEKSRGLKHGIIFEFALVTGTRPEEYLALRWTDIDLQAGVARVQRALVWNRNGGGYRMEDTKTRGSRRSVPIPKDLTAALQSHRRRQLEQRLALGRSYSNLDLVFTSELGSPLNPRNLAQRQYSSILDVSGLADRGLVLYSLRHTCARLLLSGGENPKIVAERLGHTSVKMTLDTYSHVLPGMQRSASDRLGKMLYG